MPKNPIITDLLSAALSQAAGVMQTRLGRAVSVVPVDGVNEGSLLRFDLSFALGGRLTWFIGNDDATGFSDMLIGGAGDRSITLTEMHLDGLTSAISDMLTQAVDTISNAIASKINDGDLDLGMEESLPEVDPAGQQVILGIEIEGFGTVPVVQQVDPQLALFLEKNLADGVVLPSAQTVTPAASTTTGEATQAAATATGASTDNVVSMPGVAETPAEPARAGRSSADLEMLMNVPLPITVELGDAQRTIRQLVELSVGSIIELNKLAGDPLDIKVNDRTIARGEVVVIDEEFGIRITEIMSAEDRLRGLG